MLRRLPLDPRVYTFRTYIVTSGDGFSAAKAAEFEAALEEKYKDLASVPSESVSTQETHYSIVTVPRARRVHQSYLTAPLSTIQCFWACIKVLRGKHPDQRVHPRGTASQYPDLILTNGPAAAVCVVVAAKLLRLLNAVSAPFTGQVALFPLRTIFIESWARVTSFSLSGKILLPFVDRFLVQWPNLEGRRAWRGMRETEYVGALVE
jgi:beta-1,4-N-acetylglucosaminyltransferase